MLLFYAAVNVGAFYMLATTYTEKYVGYWLSYLLAGLIYFLLPILLLAVYKRTKRSPPSGSSELTNAFRVLGIALRRNKFRIWKKGFWDVAKPSALAAQGITVGWDDKFVDDIHRSVNAVSHPISVYQL